MRVFFSAGEASGDAYAAELMTRIRSRLPETVFEGIGGRKLAALGCNPIDSSAWGSIGIPDALRVGRNVLRGASRAKKMLSSGEPGLMIPIDFGFLNIRLAKYAKDRGWKVLYFIPPGSWKRHSQGSDLPGITDLIVTPFSWSADILNEMGANARW